MQSVKLMILFSLWAAAMASFFFLILPFRGELIGITIAVIYLTLIYLLLDKWILLFFFATPSKRGDSLEEKLNNIAYSYNVRGLRFYYSRLVLNNVVALEWAGRRVLILDRKFGSSHYTDENLGEILNTFKNGEVKSNTGLLFVYAIYNLPLVLLEKLFGNYRLYNLLSSIWLTPFRILSENISLNKRDGSFLEFAREEVTEMDAFSTYLVSITGIYKTKNNDLVSMIFSRDIN